ncbi:MAG: F0F1 ATP synthase subunit B [Muribaculaceae bacterium]|nr:F0F1 ATP synthase subunit B [Muribaculaceae bacterium]
MELFTPGFGLVFWMFISFALLFLILWKFAWPVILKTVDERAELIDKGVEYAQNAKESLDNAQQQADRIIADARVKEGDILRDAEALKSQIVEQARSEARKEGQKELDAAKLAIQQARKDARQQIRDEVSEFAIQIAEKVLRGEMDDRKAQTRLVNNLLDEIENQN